MSRRAPWLRTVVVPALALLASLQALRLAAQEGAPVAAPPPLDAVRRVVARVAPSVVRVEVTAGRPRGDLPRRHLFRPVPERGGGSGVVVGADLVVTHSALVDVVAPELSLTTARGQRVAARLEHLDARREVAVLRAAQPLDVPAAELAGGPAPRVGQLVVALGDPFGTARDAAATVTLGVVEGRLRLDAPEITREGEVLLTTAAINPGSEGGALVDLDGRVVGLLAPLARDRRSGALHGHALPAEAVLAALGAAREGGPRLGLAARPAPGGLRVERVTRGGLAERAGLRAGDVLVLAGGAPLTTTDALRAAVVRAGASLRLVVMREASVLELELPLGERASAPAPVAPAPAPARAEDDR